MRTKPWRVVRADGSSRTFASRGEAEKFVERNGGTIEPNRVARPRAETPARTRAEPIPAAVDAALRRRSAGQCEVRGPNCTGRAQHRHHRLRQSAGGPHTVENLIHACVECHDGYIHAYPDRAYREGTLIRRADGPPTEPWARTPAVVAEKNLGVEAGHPRWRTV